MVNTPYSFGPKIRILLVENDPRMRVSTQALLMHWGYDVKLAMGSGNALINHAKQQARQHRCHLALIDLRLLDEFDEADISGLTLAYDVKPARPVVYSGHGDRQFLIKLLNEHKTIPFVSKGEDPEKLQQVLEGEAKKISAVSRCLRIEPADILEKSICPQLEELTGAYHDQIADALVQLFPNAQYLKLEKLDSQPLSNISTAPRPKSIVLKVYEEEFEPVIVKLARASKIEKEVKCYYEYIAKKVSGYFTARMEKYALLWDIGGASYSYIGDFDVKTFSRYYEENNIKEISESLSSFFAVVWAKRFEHAREVHNASLFELYRTVWGNWYEKDFVNFIPLPVNTLSPLHEKFQLPEPIKWLKNHVTQGGDEDRSRVEITRIAVTHGDLHADNLLIDSKKNAWVIDFERTGEGHILQDFVELEGDIINRLNARQENFASFCKLCLLAVRPTKLQKLEESDIECEDPKITKALQTISVLRSLASQCTEIADMRQYFFGLLFNTIFRATIIRGEEHKRSQQRALMLASIICHRLDHWEEPWPPQEWQEFI